MKKYLLPIFVFLFFIFSISIINAQTPSPIPTPIDSTVISTDDDNPNTFTTNPSLTNIDGFLTTVTVQFNNPEVRGNNVFVCLENDLCIDDKDIRKGINDGDQDTIDQARNGLETNKVDAGTIERYKLVDGKIEVCGDGPSKLKGKEDYFGSSYRPKNPGCKEGRDYFHAGSTHLLSVYLKNGSTYSLIAVAGFYINHGAPNSPVIDPKINIKPGKDKFQISLSSDKVRVGGDKRNNYLVSVTGPGISAQKIQNGLNQAGIGLHAYGNGTECFPLQKSQSSIVTLPYDTTLSVGQYTILVREAKKDYEYDLCEAGFTYYRIECRVSTDPLKSKCSEPVKDPNKADLSSLNNLFATLGDKGPGNKLPCREGKTVDNPFTCDTLDTAIGPIPLDPIKFIARLFQIVLAIASLGAFALIIYAGYKLLVSRGNKEIIQGARETLTAAILGLLFIIFSLVILSIITGGILHLPKFN